MEEFEGQDEMKVSRSFGQQYLYSEFSSLIDLATNRPINFKDCLKKEYFPDKCRSELNGCKLEPVWKEDSSRLMIPLLNQYRPEMLSSGVHYGISIIFSFFGPVMLNEMITSAQKGNTVHLGHMSFYIITLCLTKIVAAVLSTRYSFECTEISVSMAAAIKACVFAKVLKLSSGSRVSSSLGSLANNYTVDVDRVVLVISTVHDIWALPLKIFIGVCLLYEIINLAVIAAVMVILLVVYVNNVCASIAKRANDAVLARKDARMNALGELFPSIISIKFNCLEDRFFEKIQQLRAAELDRLWVFLFINACVIGIFWMAPSLVSVVTVATYVNILHASVDAAKIFTALSLLRMLKVSV